MAQPPLVAKPFRRDHNEPMAEIADGGGVLVPKALRDLVRRPAGGRPVDRGAWQRNHAASCATSAHTVIDLNAAGPKVVSIATSRASRPLPMSTRPTRRALLRGSNVHQRSPR